MREHQRLKALSAAPLLPRGFLPRLSDHSGKVIERELTVHSPLQEAVEFPGVVVEATSVHRQRAVLRRLGELSVPRLVDPESPRFADPSFTLVQRVASLPYAPSSPLSATTTDATLETFAREALAFQDAADADVYVYVTPELPLRDVGEGLELNRRILAFAAAANGTAVPRCP